MPSDIPAGWSMFTPPGLPKPIVMRCETRSGYSAVKRSESAAHRVADKCGLVDAQRVSELLHGFDRIAARLDGLRTRFSPARHRHRDAAVLGERTATFGAKLLQPVAPGPPPWIMKIG